MEEICQVWGGEVIESFVGDEEDFEVDSVLYREPYDLESALR